MRVGWSLGDAGLALGGDWKSFGYGGTGMKSHGGKFSKFGATYGQGDVVVSLIDLERHAILYMKNGHVLSGDAFAIPRALWGLPFFPHVATKEATVTAYFGGPAPSSQGFAPECLPAGFSWLSAMPLVLSERHCNLEAVAVEDADAVVEVDTSKLEQSAHRDQFEDWKVKVTSYAKHFQPSLACEYEAEKESVMQRVRRGACLLEATGFACCGLSIEMNNQLLVLTRPQGIPHLAEISLGRTILITEDGCSVDIDNPRTSISGEVEQISERAIEVSTTYERLPAGRTFRVDLGPNVSTYQRIDRVLDMLQSCDKPSKKAQVKIGLVAPCTALADAIFANVAETSGAARRWDPSTRPAPNPQSDVAVAARQAHSPAPARPPAAEVPKARPLNGPQQLAVEMALREQRKLTLVQGPPGTGKTTTAIEVICSWLRARKGPILATAFSNKGVNNLAEGLYKRGANVLRVGTCDPELPYSMEAHLQYYGHHQGRKGAGKGAAQSDVVSKADVICATVIGSGMSLLRSCNLRFVIVDEAAQIIEPAVLIPLAKGSVQAVMVGDQCQLPATVLSPEAQRRGLDVSLFDRLLSLGMEVHMLSVQYRMHPVIAEFPSWRFYNHRLETGVQPEDRPPVPMKGLDLGTMALIHVGALESTQGMSKSNGAEAACIEYLLHALKARCSLGEVGVITPYSAQVTCIRQAIRALGPEAGQVQVSSVDAFQGSEKEAIFLSMVRSNSRGDIGFVADWRRLNVAATRAKRLLVIVGNLATLSQHALWRDFLGFHTDIKVFEWDGRRLEALSKEPARLLSAAREASQRRGIAPLPLRGAYPADADISQAPPLHSDADWGAAPVAADVVPVLDDDVGWGAAPAVVDAVEGWGDAPVAETQHYWPS